MENFRQKTYKVIFEHDTFAGKAFDVALIILVLGSVLAVMLETVQDVYLPRQQLFHKIELAFTIIFTIELLLRIYSAPRKSDYLFSFYGLVDVLAVLPTYLAILIPGAQAFLIVRAMRLLRIFRILKLSHYTNAGVQLKSALSASKPKIIVFLFFVVTLVTIVGTAMFYIEGRENGFTSIPKSIYWAIVTMTTVGYGDITPLTTIGQILSTMLMITGYGVIAVPTGIISTEIAKVDHNTKYSSCAKCANPESIKDNFCSNCGRNLKPSLNPN